MAAVPAKSGASNNQFFSKSWLVTQVLAPASVAVLASPYLGHQNIWSAVIILLVSTAPSRVENSAITQLG